MDSTILIWDLAGKLRAEPPPTPEQLKTCWSELAGEDAAKAYRARGRLVRTARQSVPFLNERLQPVPKPDPEQIERLIADLEDEQFAVRNKAVKELERLGDVARPACVKALKGEPSAQLRRHLESLVKKLDNGYWNLGSEDLRKVRAVEVLESTATREARQHLQKLAEGASGARLTREAKAAFERLEKRGRAQSP
jgi:hypothetical protein